MEGVADSTTKAATDLALCTTELNAPQNHCPESGSSSGDDESSSSSAEDEGGVSPRQGMASPGDKLIVDTKDTEDSGEDWPPPMILEKAEKQTLKRKADMQEKARLADERAKQQKLLEELHERAEQRHRAEQQRILEEKKRRLPSKELQQPQVEAQRKHAEEQGRKGALRIHREAKVKGIYDFDTGNGGPQHTAGVATGAAAAGGAPQARSTSGTGGEEGAQRPAIARGKPGPFYNRVRWSPLLCLDLPEGLAYDMSEYTGTERARRQSSRPAVKPSSVRANLPVMNRAGNACSSTFGQSTDRMTWYTSKLRILVKRLEEVVAPPDEVVREFWEQLDAAERVRFSNEFPQCMAYITGWHSAMAPNVSSSGVRKCA